MQFSNNGPKTPSSFRSLSATANWPISGRHAPVCRVQPDLYRPRSPKVYIDFDNSIGKLGYNM